MWTWIIILLVAAGGLAIWMGAKKDKEDEGASAPEAVDAAPTVSDDSADVVAPMVEDAPEAPAETPAESEDEERPMSM